MKTRWIVFAIVIAASSVFAEPTDTHKQLCDAASVAILTSNTNLFKALLDAGLQINEPLFYDHETILGTREKLELGTPLYCTVFYHCSVSTNTGGTDLVQFLLDNGADRDKRNRFYERPIDVAYKRKHTAICELLAKPEGDKELIADLPIEAWEELLGDIHEHIFAKEIIFGVNLYGDHAPPEFIEWLRKRHPALRFHEPMENSFKLAQDNATKEKGVVLLINLRKDADDEYRSVVVFSLGWGGSNRKNGYLVNKYGYWIRTDESWYTSPFR